MANPLPRHPTFFHPGENAEQNAIFVNGGEGGGGGGKGLEKPWLQNLVQPWTEIMLPVVVN